MTTLNVDGQQVRRVRDHEARSPVRRARRRRAGSLRRSRSAGPLRARRARRPSRRARAFARGAGGAARLPRSSAAPRGTRSRGSAQPSPRRPRARPIFTRRSVALMASRRRLGRGPSARFAATLRSSRRDALTEHAEDARELGRVEARHVDAVDAIDPASGSSRRRSSRSSVDLPHPEGPQIPTTAPAGIYRESPSSTGFGAPGGVKRTLLEGDRAAPSPRPQRRDRRRAAATPAARRA